MPSGLAGDIFMACMRGVPLCISCSGLCVVTCREFVLSACTLVIQTIRDKALVEVQL